MYRSETRYSYPPQTLLSAKTLAWSARTAKPNSKANILANVFEYLRHSKEKTGKRAFIRWLHFYAVGLSLYINRSSVPTRISLTIPLKRKHTKNIIFSR